MRTKIVLFMVAAMSFACGKKGEEAKGEEAKGEEAPAPATTTIPATDARPTRATARKRVMDEPPPLATPEEVARAKEKGFTEAELNAAKAERHALRSSLACTLLTMDEATKALRKPVDEPIARSPGCSWKAEEGGPSSVHLGLRSGSVWPLAKEIAKEIATEANKPYEEIEGLGDDAYYNRMEEPQLNIKVGKRYAELSLMGVEDQGAKERLLELGRIVAGNL